MTNPPARGKQEDMFVFDCYNPIGTVIAHGGNRCQYDLIDRKCLAGFRLIFIEFFLNA